MTLSRHVSRLAMACLIFVFLRVNRVCNTLSTFFVCSFVLGIDFDRNLPFLTWLTHSETIWSIRYRFLMLIPAAVQACTVRWLVDCRTDPLETSVGSIEITVGSIHAVFFAMFVWKLVGLPVDYIVKGICHAGRAAYWCVTCWQQWRALGIQNYRNFWQSATDAAKHVIPTIGRAVGVVTSTGPLAFLQIGVSLLGCLASLYWVKESAYVVFLNTLKPMLVYLKEYPSSPWSTLLVVIGMLSVGFRQTCESRKHHQVVFAHTVYGNSNRMRMCAHHLVFNANALLFVHSGCLFVSLVLSAYLPMFFPHPVLQDLKTPTMFGEHRLAQFYLGSEGRAYAWKHTWGPRIADWLELVPVLVELPPTPAPKVLPLTLEGWWIIAGGTVLLGVVEFVILHEKITHGLALTRFEALKVFYPETPKVQRQVRGTVLKRKFVPSGTLFGETPAVATPAEAKKSTRVRFTPAPSGTKY